MKTIFVHFLIILLSFFYFPCLGQSVKKKFSKDTLLVDDAILIIEKENVLELIKGTKRFNKMDYVPKQRNQKSLDYTFTLPDYTFELLTIKIEKPHDDTVFFQNSNDHYFKLGFGNFGTGYFQSFIEKHSHQFNYGADVFIHHSLKGPVDQKNSANNKSHIHLFAEQVFSNNQSLGLTLGYDYDLLHFYGYTDKPASTFDIRQKFNALKAKIEYSGLHESGQLKGDIDFYKWNSFREEEELYSSFNLDYKGQLFNPTHKYGLGIRGVYNFRRDSLENRQNRNLINFMGTYIYENRNFDFSAGLSGTYLSDTTLSQRQISIFPNFKINYFPSQSFHIFAEMTGRIQEHYLKSLTQTNPFLGINTLLSHANNTIHGILGLYITYKQYFGFRLSADYQIIDNLLFFRNQENNLAQFDLIYDNATLSTLKANIYFKRNYFYFNLLVQKFIYELENQRQPWHKPDIQIDFTINAEFKRWTIGLDAYLRMGIRAFDFENFQRLANAEGDILLEPIIDLNISVQYRFSKKFYLFAHLNNLLSKSYQRYFRYDSKDFNFLFGGICSF